MTTSDALPRGTPSGDRVVKEIGIGWGSGQTVAEAEQSLRDWAADNNFNAVVGVAFTYYGTTPFNQHWLAYGTAIMW